MAQIDLEAISERLNLSLDHIVGTSLFNKARYFIASSITPQRALELSFLLDNNGAKKAEQGPEDDELNLIITNSLRFEGWQSVSGKEGVELVTDLWVEKGLLTGKLQLASHFSPDPSMIFSGVIACATSIPVTDYEVLQAGITALGGQWRSGLTKDVTHLFAISQDSQKYATAFNFKDQTGVKVLLPHWFDDAMRLGTGKLDTAVYEWPEPRLLMAGPAGQVDEEMVKMLKAEAVRMEQDERRMSLFATAAMFTPSNHNPQAAQSGIITDKNIKFVGAAAAHTQVWNGKRILLSRTLQVWQGRFEAVQKGIERAGGTVVRFDGDDEEEEMAEGEERVNGDGDGGGSQKAMLGPLRLSKSEKRRRKREAEAVDNCDVYVTRWRNGRAFINAFNQGKIIGTLAWLFQVQSSGIMSNPPDQLLHYPIPQRIIEGISNHVISVTNYTGEAREYLKKLITTMGARFTPSMSGQNTVLIAAYTSGTKATKALSWSIAVVNHTWLEDCFVQWRNLTVATEKYISFPPGMDFAGMLGTRGVDMESIRAEVIDLETALEEQEVVEAEEEQRELERLKLKEEEKEATALGRADADMRVPGDEEEEEEGNPPGNTDLSMKEVQGLVDSNILSPQHDINMDIDLSMDARGSALDMNLDWQFREDEFGAVSPVARKSVAEAKAKAKEQPRGRREEMEVEGPSVMEEIEMIDDDDDRDSGVVPASTRTPARSPVKPSNLPAKTAEPAKTPAKTPAKSPIKSKMKGKSPKKKGNETSPLPPLSSSEDEDDLPVVKKPTKKSLPPQTSPSPSPQPAPVPDILELSDDDDIEEVDFRAMATTQPRDKGKGKEASRPVTKKRRALESSSEDEETSESEVRKEKGKEKQTPKEPARVVGKTKGKGKASTPPPTSPSYHHEEEEEEEEVVPPKKRPLTRRLSKTDAEAGAARVKEKLKELEKQGEREKETKRSKGKQPAEERDETRSPTPEPVSKKKLTRKVTVEIIRSPVKKSAAVLLKEQEEKEKEREKEKPKAKKGRKSAREDSNETEYQASKITGLSDGEESDEEVDRRKTKTPAKPTKTPAKPPAAGKEQKKSAKGRNAAKSSDEEVDVIPVPKGASSKLTKSAQPEKDAPAPPPTAGPASRGLLKRTKGDARTKVKKRKSGEKSTPKEVEVESEDEEEEVRVVNPRRVEKGTKANTKVTGKKSKGKAVESEDEDEDEEVEDLIMPDPQATSKKDKRKGRGSNSKAAERSEDEQEEDEQPRKKKVLKKPLRVYSTEEEEASSEEDISIKGPAKPKGKVTASTNVKSSSKGKANAKKAVEPDESETESESDEEIQPKKGRPTRKPTTAAPAAKGKEAAKPKSKAVPVLTPDDTEEEEEEAEVSAVVSPRTARAVARTQSLKAVAGETRAKSPSAIASARSRKTSTSRPATSKTASRAPPRREDDDDDAMDVDEPVAGPSRLRADADTNTSATPISTIAGAPPRRSAATKASQKLRDTIMPDVMNFENQRRKSRKSGTAAFVVMGDSLPREDAEARAKRRRESLKDKEGSKEGEGDEEEGAEQPKKKRRVSDENDVVVEGKGKAKDEAGSGKARGQKAGRPSIKPGDVVVMTTQVTLPDETVKTLDKLGVKFTTTPEECTHLIAASLVRTEKFICALASNAPHILTKEWAVDSANAGKLLPVEKYGLKDPEGEKRYNVKLADALKRAKANQGGKLLDGAQIFVTPKVAVAVKKELLSHVIQACGGVCKHPSDFTQRMIKGHENRYLISCPEDKPIWSRFSNQDIPVYSHELILNGALRQRMDWNDDKYRLDKR
ncbi:hypothetical protein BJ165DRAFT_1375475 [Panaeolus papilionaceus]|nr:hypothetical protein BJ165DRAFT_1375475 [Panaeolus papilionaceus]